MSDLHRLAHRLVTVLSARDSAALAGPLVLADIAERVLPYRSCRRVLELESAEDYDLLLLRLAAEEEGLAWTFPPDAADRCRKEVRAVNPDLTLLQRLDGVTVRLNLQAIEERALATAPDAGEPSVDRAEPRAFVLAAESVLAIDAPVPEAEEVSVPTEELDLASEEEPEPEPGPALESKPEPDPAPSSVAESEPDELLADHLDLGPDPEEVGTPGTVSADFTPAAPEAEPPAPEEAVPDEPVAEAADSPNPDPGDEPDPDPVVEEDPAPVRRLSAELESLLALAAEFAEDDEVSAEQVFVGVPPAASHPAPPRCHHCTGSLPAGRPVRFCPHCGRNLVPLQCIRCRADLEPEWRHCVLCGHPTGDDSRFA